MNQINPRKLELSKWTAIEPRDRERHFLVSEVDIDADGVVIECILQAVLTQRESAIDWRDLKDSSHWLQGWR